MKLRTAAFRTQQLSLHNSTASHNQPKQTGPKADVIAFGGIAEGVVVGVRSSDRLRAQPFADATQLDRAMMIAQRRDDFFGQGTNLNKKFSLLSFIEEEIMHRASRIGVSLGEYENTKLVAARLIQDNEIQRSLVMLKNNDSNLDLFEDN
jgi:hypothetical protein